VVTMARWAGQFRKWQDRNVIASRAHELLSTDIRTQHKAKEWHKAHASSPVVLNADLDWLRRVRTTHFHIYTPS